METPRPRGRSHTCAQRQRTINFDPGYLDASKLVLATTKIMIIASISAAAFTAMCNCGFAFKISCQRLTYPDYRQPEHIAFFEQARLKYFDLLKAEFGAPDSLPLKVHFDYKAAGVDRETGEGIKKRIGELARRTFNENVLREIGLFSGFFRFAPENYREPVLVASVDGIGTKIKLACQLQRYRGLGEDIVHHCMNDIMVGGAQPLFFLDYLAFGKLERRRWCWNWSKACRTPVKTPAAR
jgi:hypothetical protein